MIKKPSFSRQHFVAIPCLLLLLNFSGCSDSDDDGKSNDMGNLVTENDDGNDDAIQETINTDGTSKFVLELTAEQEAPPLDLADAKADAELTIDKSTGAISGTVDWSNLSSDITAAHVHRGFAGINGPALFALEFVPQQPDVGAPDTVNPLRIPIGTSLDSDALAALSNGELYINVHTSSNPGGEIRGQIVPIGVLLEDSELSIEEVVEPEFASTATGLGVSTVNESSGAISATVFLTDLDDATAVEIRRGAVGENGELVMVLEMSADEANTWRTLPASMLTNTQIDDFKNEALYFNVISPRAAMGEIRGQL